MHCNEKSTPALDWCWLLGAQRPEGNSLLLLCKLVHRKHALKPLHTNQLFIV